MLVCDVERIAGLRLELGGSRLIWWLLRQRRL